MERLGLTWRLMEAYGLTTLPDATVHAPAPASERALEVWHTREYLAVLKAANGGVAPPHAERYVNDAVLAILQLKARGLRVAYVDIDAHHGDGVQYAFYDDPSVLTISTHERGDYLFPGTGFVEEAGEGAGVGYSVNLPLEPFTDSSVYLPAFEQVVPPLFAAFRPDVVVAQLGIDSHRTDPLTHLAFDVQGFTRAVARIAELAPRLVCLGGGGYDLPNVARAWTAAWAVLNGVELPAELPASFEPDRERYKFAGRTLWDPPDPLGSRER